MLEELIAVANGEAPADLVLKNGRLVNVFSGEIYPADVAIAHGRVLGWGDYAAKVVVALKGQFICPGFIDGHVHIESSMVTPAQFARAVVPAGTTTVIADPHEIANVLGLEGVRYILRASDDIPLNVFVMASSCAPATEMETAGAAITAADVKELLGEKRVIGLAEMMNFPGVLFRVPAVMDMLRVVGSRPIDGHAPGLSGKALNAYVAAGIRSDHECTTPEEALEKLQAGMHILIREGTATRDLHKLLPMVTPTNSRHCSFCTDDRHPADLLEEGHIDDLVRQAIGAGLNPMTAIQMATINTSRHYRRWDIGAVAPGYRADLLVLDNLEQVKITHVFKDGRLVAQDRQMLETVKLPAPPPLRPSVRVNWENFSLEIRAPADSGQVNVIGVIPGQVVTEKLLLPPTVENGRAVADVERDLLKIAVIERHKGTGNVGVGFVKGFGMKRGALASSVAHDSHNIVVVGTSDQEMLLAIRAVEEMAGGQAVVNGKEVVARLPLPIAGLLSAQPLEIVREQVDGVIDASHGLGCELPDPLMTMSFLALAVIPSLKITDRGLVDVDRFSLIPLWE